MLPNKRRAMESSSKARQGARRAAALKRKKEKQRVRAGEPGARNKSHLIGCLDIDIGGWDAVESAKQWKGLARHEDGSREAQMLSASDPCHISGPRDAARAAFSGRKQVAISEDELAQLGQDGCEDEAPEYARLFWGDEELEDVGCGRYYPKRFVRQAGDMPLEEWLAKEKDGTIPSGDYVVTAILDERRRPRGCIDEFIVKWKGYELDPAQWLPLSQLWECKALEVWLNKSAVDGQWHPASQARWAGPITKAGRASDGNTKAQRDSRSKRKKSRPQAA
ncbi:hypothetical protein CVIRNUC_001938 [Coccomyxa viridis]|uniref:Chromo domain-containing protein n=1 Tax=Coccomyxa viridis TaxID=1274662 RepID=A0AAV1HXM7_9CHLO|nr:hypothetical protein CVIRNUC_001938 [Coccomyxa viridis]